MRLKVIQFYVISTLSLFTIVILNYNGSIQFRDGYYRRANMVHIITPEFLTGIAHCGRAVGLPVQALYETDKGFYFCALSAALTSNTVGIFDTQDIVPIDRQMTDIYLKKHGDTLRSDHFPKHHFSAAKSDEIGGFRKLADFRHPNCLERNYALRHGDTVSVVITFHNECRSALLRTALSVLNRTPRDILKEIVLIDDHSADETDGTDLLILPQVKLQRNIRRQGLIKSRNTGAKIATGKYIVFLDSHVEVCDGWIEPLLDRISSNPGLVVSPVIDSIDARTLEYKPVTSYMKGGFDWDLNFLWTPRAEEEIEQQESPEQSFTTPTTLGGTFMISRQFFHQLGGFDSSLEIMGGEFLDISLKTWLCGGQIEVVPCSRIGHIFRKKLPYKFPLGRQQTHLRNSKRVAESWLDEYKFYYYSLHPDTKNIDITESEISRELKQKMQCKSFQWYLENIFPELKIAEEDYLAFGKISIRDKCLTAIQFDKSTEILLKDCHTRAPTHWTLHKETGHLSTTDGKCLNGYQEHVLLEDCTSKDADKWVRLQGKFIQDKTGLCLDNVYTNKVILSRCRRGAPSQLYSFSVELQKL